MRESRHWLQPPEEKCFWDSARPSKTLKANLSRPQTSMKRAQSSKALFLSRPVTRGGLAHSESIRNGLNGTPECDSRRFYSSKYLGITNGEIGILTQRRPIPTTVQSARGVTDRGLTERGSISQPKTQRDDYFPTSIDSQRTIRKNSDFSPAQSQAVAEEYLVPNPKKYDEFLVTKYIRARPLTPGKQVKATKTVEDFRFQMRKFRKTSGTALNFMNSDLCVAKPARSGVLGWKLSRPKSVTTLAAPSPPEPKPRKVTPVRKVDTVECAEAYIQYILLKKRLREAGL